MEVMEKRAGAARVYSPTHGSSAYEYAPIPAPKPRPAPEAAPRPQPKQAPAPRKKARRRLSAGTRFSLILGMAVLSAAMLAVVFRYNNIAAQYAVVNQLQSDIESAELRIRTLNVSLECAVNIKQVQEKAQSWGMTYPTAQQYVRAGDPLPAASGVTQPTNPEQSTDPDQQTDPDQSIDPDQPADPDQ